VVGDSQLGKKRGGGGRERGRGSPWELFQLLFPSEIGVLKFAFFFFLRYNFLVSAIFIVC
jgi:hypothetical protein